MNKRKVGKKVVNETAQKKGLCTSHLPVLPLYLSAWFWSGERFGKIWRSVWKSWRRRKPLPEGNSTGSVLFVQAEAVTGFAPAYLFKDVCTENSLGRQRWCLPPELRAGLSAVQSEKDEGFPRQRLQVCVQPTIKAWGFPKPGSSPVMCPMEGGGVIWPRLTTLWNWDLGDKHRIMMILRLLLLLRCVCVCVCVHVCVGGGARMSSRALLLSQVQIFAAPWTVAHQAPLSVGFSR